MLFYRLLSWLPLPLLYAASWLFYLFIYHVAGYRRAVVRDNLQRAFPEKNAAQVTILAKKFYRQLAQVAVEIIASRRMSLADFRRRVTLRNPELLRRYSEDFGRSVIVLTLHQGNWEWLLHGATAELGFPADPVYKPLHNRTADRIAVELRSRFGSRPVPVKDAARDILRHRRQARLLVMVADQAPIRRERCHWTRFMNQEAAFYLGAETLARTTGFPVLFAQCRRLRRGYYDIEFHQLASPPYSDEGHEVTERYVQLAEQAIRAEPESWLWSNRRWKRKRAAEGGR
jgi:KDO2-lipid IV(A) lauroyltransferase